MGPLFPALAVFGAFALSARADIVCYEYMTIGGSAQADGVYVLTDYVPKSNTVVRAMYSSSSAATSGAGQFLFCSRLTSGANTANLHFSFLPNSGGKFRFDYHGTQSGASSSFTANSFYMLEVKAGKAYVTDAVSGSVVTLGSGLQSFTPQYKMALFQSYSYSGGEYGSWNNAFHGKFYYLKVFDIENGEEVLKHHFVPCLDGDVVKLCDLADSNATYALTSTGSGSASVGGKVVSGAYSVDNSGTITLPAPSSYGLLVNTAPECVFDQTADSASAENAHSFTGFQSYRGSETFFKGGWWDFGATDATTNFFGEADGFSNRRTEFSDGAVVTNVGSVCLAGASGTDNALELKGGASMTLRDLVFGKAQSAQRSTCRVTGGSTLHCLGNISMSEGSARDHERNRTGNELVVSGEGSGLVVDGVTYLGRNLGYNYNGGLGGNTLAVSNNATAYFNGGIMGNDAIVHGMFNHVVFSDGARVNMTSFKMDNNYSTTGKPSSNLVEILSGAVVTNTGEFTFGYGDSSWASRAGNEIVISNATLVTKPGKYGTSTGFLCGHRMTARLSGPDANLKFTTFPEFFFGERAPSTFIVENEAKFKYDKEYFAMNGTVCGHRFIVRSGATVTAKNGFKTCSYGNVGSNNVIRVESDGFLNGEGVIAVVGKSNTMEVVEGKVYAGYYLYVGQTRDGNNNIVAGSGTNCLLHIAGTHPSVRCNWTALVSNGSTVRIALPEEGYDEGHAVSTNAVFHVISAGQGMGFDNSSTLELTGVEAMLKYHRAHKKKADYYLLHDGTPASYIFSDERLADIQATLPSEMAIFRKTSGNNEYVILSVRPMWGTTIVFH